MPKIGSGKISRKIQQKPLGILQGLGVALAAVTERWPRKEEKRPQKNQFFSIFSFFFLGIYLLVMPKYWGKQIFSLRSFPEVGQKQKTEREERPRVAHAKPPGPNIVHVYLLIHMLMTCGLYFNFNLLVLL